MQLLTPSLHAPSFHILHFCESPPQPLLRPPPPTLSLPPSPPRVVLVWGKWEPDVAYCAEVGDGRKGGLVGVLGEVRLLGWRMGGGGGISWQAFCSFTRRPETGKGFPGRRRMSRVGGVRRGSDSATRTQRPLPDLGVPVVWGTLGSMFGKITLNILNFAWLYVNWRRRLQLSLFVASMTANLVASVILMDFCLFFMQLH